MVKLTKVLALIILLSLQVNAQIRTTTISDTVTTVTATWTHNNPTGESIAFKLFAVDQNFNNPQDLYIYNALSRNIGTAWFNTDTTLTWLTASDIYGNESTTSDTVRLIFTYEPEHPPEPIVYVADLTELQQQWRKNGAVVDGPTDIKLFGSGVPFIGNIFKGLQFEESTTYKLSVIAAGESLELSVGSQNFILPLTAELREVDVLAFINRGDYVVRISTVQGHDTDVVRFKKVQASMDQTPPNAPAGYGYITK